MQYKLDLWSKHGFGIIRLLLPQFPLDRHLKSVGIGKHLNNDLAYNDKLTIMKHLLNIYNTLHK